MFCFCFVAKAKLLGCGPQDLYMFWPVFTLLPCVPAFGSHGPLFVWHQTLAALLLTTSS